MTGLEERVADQLNEKALDAAADVAYTHHELWARTSGSPTDLAIRSIISAYLSALESQGLKIVPVEPTGAMLDAGEVMIGGASTANAARAFSVYAAMLNAVQEG